MSSVCIGIAKKSVNSHSTWDKKGIRGGKKYNFAYFYDENGKFHSKRITKSEEIKIRLQGIYKRKFFICKICSSKFLGLIKKDSDIPECPYCK